MLLGASTHGAGAGTQGIWGERAVLPGAERGRGLRGSADPRDCHDCRSVKDLFLLLRGAGRLGAQASPRVRDVPHRRRRLLGLPRWALAGAPAASGRSGPSHGHQANLRQWLLLTASALFVLVPAISLVEALRNLLEQYVPRQQVPAGGGFSSPWTPSSPSVSPTCPRVGPPRLQVHRCT